jgi:hypothetical protein
MGKRNKRAVMVLMAIPKKIQILIMIMAKVSRTFTNGTVRLTAVLLRMEIVDQVGRRSSVIQVFQALPPLKNVSL